MTTAPKIPWVQMYGVWSEEQGWWFTNYTIFYTEHYSVALAQRDMLQQHYPPYLDDGSVVRYEVRPLPDDEPEEINEH